jgi:hypothetical protein
LIVQHTITDDKALRELTEGRGDEPEPSR